MVDLSVCVVTWPRSPERVAYLRRTLEAIKRNALDCKQFTSEIVISTESDGVFGDLFDELSRVFLDFDVAVMKSRKDRRPCLGANMNQALSLGTGRYLLLLQDDWILNTTVNFAPFIHYLDEHPACGLVRLGWSENPVHTMIGPTVRHRFEDCTDIRVVDPRSAYFYGDQPNIRRRTWIQDFGGAFVESGNLGLPEVELTGRLKESRLQVVCACRNYFDHCGEVSSVTEQERHA